MTSGAERKTLETKQVAFLYLYGYPHLDSRAQSGMLAFNHRIPIGRNMSRLQESMLLDERKAREQFAAAAGRFHRVVGISEGNFALPMRRIAGQLLLIQADLRNPDHVDLLHVLHGEMIKRDRQMQQVGLSYLQKQGLIAEINLARLSRPAEAFDADWLDLAILHSMAEFSAPQRILELGSGLSTVVLGHAARKVGGQLLCLEPSEEWKVGTFESLPENMHAHVSLITPPVVDVVCGGRETKAFEIDAGYVPDFIYIDGAPRGSVFRGLETAIQLEDELLPGTVFMLDARVAAVAAILGLSGRGALDEKSRAVSRQYDVMVQGILTKFTDSAVNLDACFGLDKFFNAAALLVK